MAKISVIVPVYNVEKYIEKCLNSLVNQTFKDIEIIIINDGSTDSSEKIILQFLDKYDNIKYFKKINGGLSDARNYGMEKATSKYIAFLDSDDYVEKTLYEKLYSRAEKENLDVVEADFIWEYENKKKTDNGKKLKDKWDILLYGRVVAWNKLYKRKIIEEKFPSGLRYEDVEFYYKLIPNISRYGLVSEPLIHYVQRSNSLSNNQNEKTADIFQIFKNVINFYKSNNLLEDYGNEVEYSVSRILLCSSLKRIFKIQDENLKKELIDKTFKFLSESFPHWRKNKYLKSINFKNIYMRTLNKRTIKLYSKILR